MQKKTKWLPEICYSDSDDENVLGGSTIPFINVPRGEEMPKLLFIFECKDSGEVEPDSEGNELSIVNWDLRQYVLLHILKQNLKKDTYDEVRSALDLLPLDEAIEKGKKITESVRNNLKGNKN